MSKNLVASASVLKLQEQGVMFLGLQSAAKTANCMWVRLVLSWGMSNTTSLACSVIMVQAKLLPIPS